ncbi:SDR family oxidoreductase [Larkinella arboricola]|uniref:NAD(P)-dependent dehydrogenase (Short-subunit alcohol dehydrogenase family) n=1 Tax=Larkinella arboricola TaxID=643671 RepID=A0A327WTW9_LARAB|nr:SDR family oxidoreductase [Larkinella arboricola]RAJ95850.1 NAD(P)-dependent dehydrogenase (short-subunit alcohol dehydrogenase family) [Larkinella arboricola]
MNPSRTCLITGANSGIGRVTALELAKKGFDIIMLCRNMEKARPVRQEIKKVSKTGHVDLVWCDMASQVSVMQAAREIADRYDRLDVLLNNAGLYIDKKQDSPDGIELTFATNHLGPFLLTNLLLNLLRKGTDPRIVTVSSEAHRWDHGFVIEELAKPRKYDGMRAYGASKLCNILFTNELAKRLADDGITANSLHPGAVKTNFGQSISSVKSLVFSLMRPFFISPEKGAETSIYLTSSPDVQGQTGLYFAKCRPKVPSAAAQSQFNASQLWTLSEQLTQLKSRLVTV